MTLAGLADALDSWVAELSETSLSAPAFSVSCRFGNATVAGDAYGSDYNCQSPAASFHSGATYGTVPIAVSSLAATTAVIAVSLRKIDDAMSNAFFSFQLA